MQHHSACDAHHRLDASLGNSVVMVGTNTCELRDLGKVFEVGAILVGGEGGPVVGEVSLRNDAEVTAVPLKLCLAFHRFVSVKMDLLRDEKVA